MVKLQDCNYDIHTVILEIELLKPYGEENIREIGMCDGKRILCVNAAETAANCGIHQVKKLSAIRFRENGWYWLLPESGKE